MTVGEFIQFIKNSTQHTTLYHFTDEANLPSIAQHGILSKKQLRERGLWPPAATGGNELSWQLDQHRGIDPSVSLCMTRNHGMKFLAHQAGRLPNPRYLVIQPEVLEIPGTRIALGVANANDVEILPIANAIDRLDVEVLYTDIEFNPEKQVNCQARAFAEYKSLVAKSKLEAAVEDFRYFASMLPPI